ncbi:MAG: D-alanyl-D-alanine carboxypeptidase family protein [Desulfovibrionaceae bacterium]
MFKKLCRASCTYVVVCWALVALCPALGYAQLDVRSAILMDMDTGQVLFEQNADTPIPPASLTKILSMYVIMDRIANKQFALDDMVKVSKTAANTGGSRMHLKAYERVSMDTLLMGMAVSSGNDASEALAEYVGGSQENFVRMMNDKARSVGMNSSFFANPHGLPAAGQVTTARDMLSLSYKYLSSFPDALRYHSTRFMKHNGVVSYNKNPLLGNYKGADGLKTGWVNASGYNLISTASQDNSRLLAVVLGAENTKTRAQEIHRLMEAGFMLKRNQVSSIPDALRFMPPRHFALNLDNTKRDAYATLAPEVLKQGKASAHKKNLKASKNRRHAQKAAKRSQAHKKSKKDTRQASLHRKNS